MLWHISGLYSFLWPTVHCMDIPQFVSHLSAGRHLGYFYFLAIRINATMSIHAQVFVWLHRCKFNFS